MYMLSHFDVSRMYYFDVAFETLSLFFEAKNCFILNLRGVFQDSWIVTVDMSVNRNQYRIQSILNVISLIYDDLMILIIFTLQFSESANYLFGMV